MTNVYIDAETTAFTPKKGAIIQVGAIGNGPYGEPLKFQSLVNPGDRILRGLPDDRVFRPTKIKVGDVKKAPPAKEVAEKLHDFLALFQTERRMKHIIQAKLFSFNQPFEERFLSSPPWKLFHWRWGRCVMRQAKGKMRISKMPKLSEAAKHYGVQIGAGAHDALVDAETLMRLHWKMVGRIV